jgi:hypothetical protein
MASSSVGTEERLTEMGASQGGGEPLECWEEIMAAISTFEPVCHDGG